MKYIVTLLAVMLLLASCSSSKKAISTNDATGVSVNQLSSNTTQADGSSFEKAIVINEKSESTGIDAEYAWLKKNYPGYKTKSQQLANHNKKPFDIITIETAQSKLVDVYFDISKFFGKGFGF